MTRHQDRWNAAAAPWIAARRAELAYDRDVFDPAYAAGSYTPQTIDEADRLTNARADLEDAIFAIPALTAEQLATKVLMAFDNGRDANGWMGTILRDCRRFADDSLTRGMHSVGLDLDPDQTTIIDPIVAMLEERNAIFGEAEVRAPLPDPEMDALIDRGSVVDARILAATPTTIAGLVAKLMLQMQLIVEGFEVGEEHARTLIHESRALTGIGAFINPTLATTPEVRS